MPLDESKYLKKIKLEKKYFDSKTRTIKRFKTKVIVSM
jgi:hypothetical protein